MSQKMESILELMTEVTRQYLKKLITSKESNKK